MLWNLDPAWLLMALTVVVILSFALSLALDAIMGHESFGATGNMVIITVGFFLGIALANHFGLRLDDLMRAGLTGLGGAFASLFVLTALKGLLNRM